MLSSNSLLVHNEKDLVYLTFPHFDNTGLVNHCFTTKLGGISKGIFESLNLGFGRGDDEYNVRENYKRICRAIDVNEEDLVLSNQVHKTNIRIVTDKDRGKGYSKDSDIIEIDGLITNVSKVPLITYYADCVPLFFLDPIKKVVALAHAGWRGTVNKIGSKMVNVMEDKFNSKPKDIMVGIGPSIGLCCFEVGKEVAMEFIKAFDYCQKDVIKAGQKDKFMIDLWSANKNSLMKAGILEENIVVTDLCTMCNKDYFYSHRGHKGKRGNLAAIIELI